MESLSVVFEELKKQFNELWTCQEREETLEITGPYATATSGLISIFLTLQSKNYVLSDGGWISDGFYDVQPEEINQQILKQALEFYQIKVRKDKFGRTYYYNKTAEASQVAARVFDLIHFITLVINVTAVCQGNGPK